jgi:hypothetical protein
VNCTIFESRLLSPWRRCARPVSCWFSVANRHVGADSTRILAWLVRGRQLEVTFQEARRHLGMETQRQMQRPAGAVLQSAWYRQRHPTFADTRGFIERLTETLCYLT